MGLIGQLAITLGLNSSAFDSGIQKAVKTAQQGAGQIKGSLSQALSGNLFGAGSSLLAPLATGGIFGLGAGLASSGLGKLSEIVGGGKEGILENLKAANQF